MIKKSDLVRNAVAAQDWKTALKIAKDFRLGITREQHSVITRAYECIVHPDFYRQLGKNLECEINRGKEIVAQMYG